MILQAKTIFFLVRANLLEKAMVFRQPIKAVIFLERSDAHESRVNRKSIDDDYEKALSIIGRHSLLSICSFLSELIAAFLSGFGKFHLILLIICAFANASDAIEILCISFVMPSAECDLKISTPEKGILSSMTFLGSIIIQWISYQINFLMFISFF